MIEILIKGGVIMIPLLACSIAAVAVVIDRTIAFRANAKVDTRALRARVLTLLAEGKLDDAIRSCATTPSAVSSVLLAGLNAYKKYAGAASSRESLRMIVEDAMQDHSLHAMSAIEKRFGVLTTVGNAAPLLGMTGTVTGMIAAFKAFVTALDPAEVGKGIAEALITTAAGLIIALIAVIPYNWLNSKASAIDLEIQEAISELVDFITIAPADKAA